MTGEWVALCAARVVSQPLSVVTPQSPCPFCPEGSARRGQSLGGEGSAWATPHRAPALIVEASDAPLGEGRRHGLGAHEVLLESEEHTALHHQPLQASIAALRLVRARHRDLWGDRRLRWLGWHRHVCGEHPVSTVVGAAVVPSSVAQEQAVAGSLRQVVHDERASGARWLGEVDGVGTWCTFAPAVPFEVVVGAADAGPQLALADDHRVDATARILRAVAIAFEATLGLSHEVVLHQAPRGERGAWYLKLRPRVGLGGPALGGMLPSHSVFPEEAAEQLRPQLALALCHDGQPGEVRP